MGKFIQGSEVEPIIEFREYHKCSDELPSPLCYKVDCDDWRCDVHTSHYAITVSYDTIYQCSCGVLWKPYRSYDGSEFDFPWEWKRLGRLEARRAKKAHNLV